MNKIIDFNTRGKIRSKKKYDNVEIAVDLFKNGNSISAKECFLKAQVYFDKYEENEEDVKLLDKTEYYLKEALIRDKNNPKTYYMLFQVMCYKNPEACIEYLEKARICLYNQKTKDKNLIIEIEENLCVEYFKQAEDKLIYGQIEKEDYLKIKEIILSLKKNGYIDEDKCIELGLANEGLGLIKEAINAYKKAIDISEQNLEEEKLGYVINDSYVERNIQIIVEATNYLIDIYSLERDYISMRNQIEKVLEYPLIKEDFIYFNNQLKVITKNVKEQQYKNEREKQKKKLKLIATTSNKKLKNK